MPTYFSSGSIRIPVLLLSYSEGIDSGIVHSCMYPKYFLPDFTELHLKANAIISNSKDVLTQ